jgi:hypothetical protein
MILPPDGRLFAEDWRKIGKFAVLRGDYASTPPTCWPMGNKDPAMP